jgi:hypothetical protein
VGLLAVRGPAPACFVDYVLNELPKVVSDDKIMGALGRISGCSASDVAAGLVGGAGPEVVPSDLPADKGGQFDPNDPDEFAFNAAATRRFCSGCTCPNQSLGMEMNLLHEYTHYLFRKCRGVEPSAVVDAGDTFEEKVYGPRRFDANDAFFNGCTCPGPAGSCGN